MALPVAIPNPPAGPDHGPPSIIYGGLMRMGSFSLAHALATLGFRTHHNLETEWEEWRLIADAMAACYPDPKHPRPPYTRAQWDRLYGGFDAVTDAASFYTPQLIAAYPEAKVILVQRDFDAWYESMQGEVAAVNLSSNPFVKAGLWLMVTLMALPLTDLMHAFFKNRFHASSMPEFEVNARRGYDEHYATVRAMVPPKQLLEYRLADGWGPLCRFLDRPVPDVPFPRLNDRADHRHRVQVRGVKMVELMWINSRPYVLVVAAVATGAVAWRIGPR